MSGHTTETDVLVAGLRRIAEDGPLLWTVARRAIEDQLIEWRDHGLMMPHRNNGFVVKDEDGSVSSARRAIRTPAPPYLCRHGKYRGEHGCDDHADHDHALRGGEQS